MNLIENRVQEAAKLGFKTAVIPRGNSSEIKKVKGINVVPVSNVKEAISAALRQ